MGWSSAISGLGKPIDRILYWIESAFKDAAQRAEENRQKKILLREFEASSHNWLTLGRLIDALTLNPADPADRNKTRKLLGRLPPPGPARLDNTPANRDKPEAERLWGLPTIIGQKRELLRAFEASSHNWLTLGRLTGHVLKLDPQNQDDLETTKRRLESLPNPPGPARQDRTPANREKPDAEQLWGLTSVVGP